MKTLIFADVHLKVGAAGEARRKSFVRFLHTIDPDEVETVIILGDLFDFWFEYRQAIFSGFFEVLRALADLHDRGVAFHLICGNHDFWAGTFLEDHLGFVIHHEPYECRLGDKRAVFVHGDGVNPSDVGYRVFKRFARSPLVIRLFRLLHPDWAMWIAMHVSSSTRRYLSPEDPSESREVVHMQRFAQGILDGGEADMVFCAHTHYPVEEELPTPNGTGVYFNTGAWMDSGTYLEWDGTELRREHFRLDDEDLSSK